MSKKKRGVENYLRNFRVKRGLSQKDVSEILSHKNQSTVSGWESGAHIPSLINILRLAALYRTSVIFIYHYVFLRIREEIRLKEEAWKERFCSSKSASSKSAE